MTGKKGKILTVEGKKRKKKTGDLRPKEKRAVCLTEFKSISCSRPAFDCQTNDKTLEFVLSREYQLINIHKTQKEELFY